MCSAHSQARAESGKSGHGASEGDQLGQLRLVVDLGARAGWVRAVAGPAGERKIGDVADVGQGQSLARGEGVPGGQDGDLPLGQQFLAVEPGEGVERRVHERHIGAAVAQHFFLLTRAARQHLDLGGVGLGRVGVEELLQQLVRRGGLHCQHQAVAGTARTVGATGATGAASGSGGRVEGRAALVQQHLTGAGQGDAAAVAFQQGDAEAPLELLDRPGQRRLGHAEALGGAAEVQLLGDGR